MDAQQSPEFDDGIGMVIDAQVEVGREQELAAACARVDVVVSNRWLPRSCQPKWLKADRRYLERSGGLAIDLADRAVVSVADSQGDHGWWIGPEPRRPRPVSTR